MKFDTKEPCGSCPYRKDAKLGLWHPQEFDNLARTEADPLGSIFACHATGKKRHMSVCAGWLIKQREADLPSIMLRLRVGRDPTAREALETVSDGGHELYADVQAMIEANEKLGRCEECGRYKSDNGRCPAQETHDRDNE